MKKLLRFLLFAAVVAAVVWATREQMLPKPPPPDHHPPPFRKPPGPGAVTSAPAPAPEPTETPEQPVASTPDDLQRVKGIGPVYEGKLHDLGVHTFADLIGADSDRIAADLDVQVASVVDWKTQATEFLD